MILHLLSSHKERLRSVVTACYLKKSIMLHSSVASCRCFCHSFDRYSRGSSQGRHQLSEPGPGRQMGQVALRRRKARGTGVAGGGMVWGSRTMTTRHWRLAYVPWEEVDG
ncbi:hypothetical protein ACFX14_003056 [Malus domestica]